VSRYALLILGIAGLSMAGIFYKMAQAPVLTIVAYRMLLAALFMVPVALISRASGGQTRSRFSRSDTIVTLVSGTLFALDLALWATSLSFTSVASAALFVSTQPIFVAVLAALIFRERPTLLVLAGIAIGVAGMAVVGWQDVRLSGSALWGDALAMLAALAETGYLLCGRQVRKRIDAPRYALAVYAICAAVITATAFAQRNIIAVSVHDLLMCAGLAIVATVLGHTLVSLSLGYMPAAVVAVSFLAQPLLAAVFALIFLAQLIPAATVLGGLIALAGIGLVAYSNEQEKRVPEEALPM